MDLGVSAPATQEADWARRLGALSSLKRVGHGDAATTQAGSFGAVDPPEEWVGAGPVSFEDFCEALQDRRCLDGRTFRQPSDCSVAIEESSDARGGRQTEP